MGLLKDRYQFGWTDPRATTMNQPDEFEGLGSALTGFEDVDTEVLRNLWMVKFGGRGITMRQLYDVREEDINMVAMELYRRKQVKREIVQSPYEVAAKILYILEKEQNGDH
jgi:hypothetical protein